MIRIAIQMLVGDRAKFLGLLFGITFTSFLVTFSASFFCGFMTRGFALISENPGADVWVMDPTVQCVDQPTNMPGSALTRVRSVPGVQHATPLAIGTAEARFPNGRVQSVQVIGVDDATLIGFPATPGGARASSLRAPDAAVAATGGTDEKLDTPHGHAHLWPHDGPHLDVPVRLLAAGDELEVNEHRVVIAGLARALPRFPPRPLLYTTLSKATEILPPERHRLTYVLAKVLPGASPGEVAARIERQTGLRARTTAEFERASVLWTLQNSEDVGDVTAQLILAITVGFGVTGVLLHMFTSESLRQYAVLTAMGTTPRELVLMIFAQVGVCSVLGTGMGLGVCGIVGVVASEAFEYPFRMMWFTPLFGLIMVGVVGCVAALASLRPVLKLDPASVFGGR